MISLLIGAGAAFVITILVTPIAISLLRRWNIGQFIQEEVEGHHHKRGTPTMGGIVIIGATVLGYAGAHLRLWTIGEGWNPSVRPFSVQGGLVVFAFVGMALIGFLDDFTKYVRSENQGLSKRWKFLGQLVIAGVFAWGAVAADVSTGISFTRDNLGIELGPWLYGLWVLLMLTGAANAVNLSDGLDGLAAGSASLVFGAFTVIAFWQFRNFAFYRIDGALDLGIFAASLLGATLAFLWWNAAPARIFMGDTGSQALGGSMAALALLTDTHLLLVVLGGLYVMTTFSVILQVIAFRGFGRRIFRMAPIHHHFELMGWPETTVIVRFWILAAIGVALGLGIFYGDFVAATGGGL